MRLSEKIILQKQPCNNSCAITCIAMAADLPVEKLLETFKNIKIKNGMDDRQICFVLTTLGIGSAVVWPAMGATGLLEGLYLASTPSLNTVTALHCLLVKVAQDGSALAYDPNTGKEGKKYHDIDDFCSIPFINFIKLDDFEDLKNGN